MRVTLNEVKGPVEVDEILRSAQDDKPRAFAVNAWFNNRTLLIINSK